MEKYKLSTVLEGHKLDVRCICPVPMPEIGKNLFPIRSQCVRVIAFIESNKMAQNFSYYDPPNFSIIR